MVSRRSSASCGVFAWTVVKHVKVVASLPETGDIMKPGMTVRSEILVDHVDDALSIPQEAVFVTEERTYVFRKAFRGFEEVDVELGARNDTHVVITAGVQEGDEVALVDPDRFEAGDAAPASSPAASKDES